MQDIEQLKPDYLKLHNGNRVGRRLGQLVEEKTFITKDRDSEGVFYVIDYASLRCYLENIGLINESNCMFYDECSASEESDDAIDHK